MQFFPQNKSNNCQIVVIKTVLSFYDIKITESEITKALPKHTFGNTLDEISQYLTSISIPNTIRENNSVLQNDIQDKPIIVNVDLNKILQISGKTIPHYIVLLKENETLWMYEGSHHSERVEVSFDKILAASKDINRPKDGGKWLFIDVISKPLNGDKSLN